MSTSETLNYENFLDDETIGADTFLYRRILNQPDPPVRQIVWDDNKQCWRPSSVAFDNHPNGSPMSVAIDDTLKANNLSPDSLLVGHEDFSLAIFTAKVARDNNQGVIRKPLDNDPAHGEVFGKKTKSVKKALAKNSTWYREPDLPQPIS
ncbi:MAG: hypothetical protein Q8K07_02315 [Methylicorpusculum sp.]|uniref:hypothetical protein n=1 Tax=Methylicorpusculum sp. TaxID=2713644 RepID=UPI0027302F34|nr:hypothetical protein [Methylicorpusculum sp.]MDP2200826.1 hypothetical protein [Methylicorpusculum sp.]